MLEFSELPEVYVTVTESDLMGDLVAYNGSYISWSLASYSSWTGSAYSGFGDAYFDVTIDETSTWILTNTTIVQVLADADSTLSNIESGGYEVQPDLAAPSGMKKLEIIITPPTKYDQ